MKLLVTQAISRIIPAERIKIKIMISMMVIIAVAAMPNSNAQIAAEITDTDDIFIEPESLILIPKIPVEGQMLRIYASARSNSEKDYYGAISFYIDGQRIGSPQSISIVNGKSDQVFMDWKPSFGGPIDIRADVESIGVTEQNTANNSIQITDAQVDFDTDGDGIGNGTDSDIDNDGCSNTEEETKGSDPKNPASNACSQNDQSTNRQNQPVSEQTGGGNNAGNSERQNDSESSQTQNQDSASRPNSSSNESSGKNAGNIAQETGSNQNQTSVRNNLGSDSNQNTIPDFLEPEISSIFQNQSPSVLGLRLENSESAAHDNTAISDIPNKKKRSEKKVLGFRITKNDSDGDGIPNTEDNQQNDPAPILDLEIKNLGLRRLLFDAGESTDDTGIVKYTLILGPEDKIESAASKIQYQFPTSGFYDIIFTIEDTVGQKRFERITVEATLLSTRLILKICGLILILYFIVIMRHHLKKD